MSRASSKIKRKFCRLHGWAPHTSVAGCVQLLRVKTNTAIYTRVYQCCRCNGVPGMTRTAKIKAFLRGFKLRQRVPSVLNAREYVGDRFQN